jgi:type II secretory pathway component PulJ
MSTLSLLVSIAILALMSAGAVYLLPVLKEQEVAVAVADIQAAAAAFRDAQVGAASLGDCRRLPAQNDVSLDVIDSDLANPSGSAGRAVWSVSYDNGQGVIKATTSDNPLGHMIARVGGGVRIGNDTFIPVLRPSALNATHVLTC